MSPIQHDGLLSGLFQNSEHVKLKSDLSVQCKSDVTHTAQGERLYQCVTVSHYKARSFCMIHTKMIHDS